MGSPVSFEFAILLAAVGGAIALFLAVRIGSELRLMRGRRSRFNTLMAELAPSTKERLDELLVEIHNVRKHAEFATDTQWKASLKLRETLDACLDTVLDGLAAGDERALSNMTETTKAIRTEWNESPVFIEEAMERLRAAAPGSKESEESNQEEE